jgi:hypothetical protein
VNYSPNPAHGWLRLVLPLETGDRVIFRDELTGKTYNPAPNEMTNRGLYVDLNPYQAHLLDVTFD